MPATIEMDIKDGILTLEIKGTDGFELPESFWDQAHYPTTAKRGRAFRDDEENNFLPKE